MCVKQFVVTFSHGSQYFLSILLVARYVGTKFYLLNSFPFESE